MEKGNMHEDRGHVCNNGMLQRRHRLGDFSDCAESYLEGVEPRQGKEDPAESRVLRGHHSMHLFRPLPLLQLPRNGRRRLRPRLSPHGISMLRRDCQRNVRSLPPSSTTLLLAREAISQSNTKTIEAEAPGTINYHTRHGDRNPNQAKRATSKNGVEDINVAGYPWRRA